MTNGERIAAAEAWVATCRRTLGGIEAQDAEATRRIAHYNDLAAPTADDLEALETAARQRRHLAACAVKGRGCLREALAQLDAAQRDAPVPPGTYGAGVYGGDEAYGGTAAREGE